MTLLDLTTDKLYLERAARLCCSHVAVIGIYDYDRGFRRLLSSSTCNYKHFISRRIRSPPNFQRSLKQYVIPIKWKRLLAPTRSLFYKWFVTSFYLFVISFFWNLVIKIFCQKETTNYRYLIKLFATTNVNFYKIFLFPIKKIFIFTPHLYLKIWPISWKFIWKFNQK